MADTDGPMDCITAHAREEAKDIPQHVGRCYTTQSMKRPGGVLCPSTYQTIIWYRPSVRGHQCRPSITGHQYRPSIKGHRSKPNTRGTTEIKQTKNRARCERKRAKAHVGRDGEKKGGGVHKRRKIVQ